MAHSESEYTELLKSLLPPGQAFPREGGTNLELVLSGLAPEFVRVEGRADRLALEVNPLEASELLSDWERAAGLPDKCAGTLETTVQGRRNALVAKLTSTGGQSKAYFIEVAAALGFKVTISEFRPFRAGLSQAGDPLTNGDWAHVWRINAPTTTVISFRAGQSSAGEALRAWGNDSLTCKIDQLKPAHTLALTGYGAAEIEALYLSADRLFFSANYTIPELVKL